MADAKLIDTTGTGYHENVPYQVKSKVVVAPFGVLEADVKSSNVRTSLTQAIPKLGKMKTSIIGLSGMEVDWNREMYKDKKNSIQLNAGFSLFPLVGIKGLVTNQNASMKYVYTGNSSITLEGKVSSAKVPFTYKVMYNRSILPESLSQMGLKLRLKQKVFGQVEYGESPHIPSVDSELRLDKNGAHYVAVQYIAKSGNVKLGGCVDPRKFTNLINGPCVLGAAVEAPFKNPLSSPTLSLFSGLHLTDQICLNSCINNKAILKLALSRMDRFESYQVSQNSNTWMNNGTSCSLALNLIELCENAKNMGKVSPFSGIKMGFKVNLTGDISDFSNKHFAMFNILSTPCDTVSS